MKLCVHFISKGVYWRAGDDVPENEVPDFVRKYVVTGNGEPKIPAPPKARTLSQVEGCSRSATGGSEQPQQKLRKRYVKRGVAWRRVKDVAVKVGEPVFIRIGPAHYEEIGNVRSDGSLPQVFP